MKPLPETFRIGGWDFTIVERVGDVVLARKVHPDVPRAAYEVAIVQRHETYTIAGATVPAHEAMPGTETFGRLAWAPVDLPAARVRFEAVKTARRGGQSAADAAGGSGGRLEPDGVTPGQPGPNDPVCDRGRP